MLSRALLLCSDDLGKHISRAFLQLSLTCSGLDLLQRERGLRHTGTSSRLLMCQGMHFAYIGLRGLASCQQALCNVSGDIRDAAAAHMTHIISCYKRKYQSTRNAAPFTTSEKEETRAFDRALQHERCTSLPCGI